MGSPIGLSVIPKWMVSLGGLFDRTTKEVVEMAYQDELSYAFDSSKPNAKFGFEPVSYAEGMRKTANAYQRKDG